MNRLKIIIIALLFSTSASADSAGIANYLKSDVIKVGEGQYWFLFVHAYNAALYSPNGKFDISKPYALEITYMTDISGKDIAERSIKEMKKIDNIDTSTAKKWESQMAKIFPDVGDGTVMTGISIPEKGAVFLKDGKKVGEINDPRFARIFFGVWLDPRTSDNNLRKNLLGIK